MIRLRKKDTSTTSLLKELVAPDGVMDVRLLEARSSFWNYCKYINPKFYRDDRVYLRELCDTLQGVFEGTIINPATGDPYKKLMINLPPRHGKSYTLVLFSQWMMGRNNETRVITVSYNDMLATRFARGVRDGIDATKADSRFSIFTDVFPATRIKYGDASVQFWALEGQYYNYLAAGFGGTITGVGCSVGIIDDPIKSDKEAYNSRVLDEQWTWYGDTFLSRIEEGGIQIVNMTRWSTKDLCGMLLDSEDGADWLVYKRAACMDKDQGIMLCPSVLSYKSYTKKARLTSPEIMDANYNQQPIDIKGKLYSEMQTYDDIPRGEGGRSLFERIVSYTDTADTGADYLCSIVAGEYKGELWVLDVLYTDAPMEQTEPETAKQLFDNDVNYARIESNNGGRGFARNVERLLYENHGSRRTVVDWMHQSANKVSRILSASSFIVKHVYFPNNWDKRWPLYYAAMNAYQKAGKNAHDDAPDATTGLAELVQEGADNELLLW